MAKRSFGSKQLGMMKSPAPAPAPAPFGMMGGRIGGGLPNLPKPLPKIKPKRAPVMKRKGVALSKFGPGAVIPPKRAKKAKLPMF